MQKNSEDVESPIACHEFSSQNLTNEDESVEKHALPCQAVKKNSVYISKLAYGGLVPDTA
ncbi:hypothetical protein KI387_014299, partial [Taxus chinensis]